MTESPAEHPRVRVTLPGGQVVDGLLLSWRQDPDGTWVPAVAIEVPASAVTRVDGEDYSHVPREPAGQRYVIVTRHGPVGGKPKMILHTADCWAIDRKYAIRVTDCPTPELARGALRFDDTTACDVCRPEP